MKRCRYGWVSVLLVFVACVTVHAQMPGNYQLDRDWLIDGTLFKARIDVDQDRNEVIVSNGLIRRVIRLKPNAATVGFDNLMTGETIIRAVRPEARVKINGITYPVGGLTGQPDHAYLTEEWLNRLQSIPNSLQFTAMEVGVPKERFAWKRTRHHAPDVQWPPKGVYLRMDYTLPQAVVLAQTVASLPSDAGRVCLFREEFQDRDDGRLGGGWKVHTSKAHPRSSFENEGKVGEIYTPANTCAYLERSLSPEVRLVEVTIDTGTDTSASWGPGIALVWPKRTIKFYLRPNGKVEGAARFALWDGVREHLAIGEQRKLDLSKPWTLRMRIEQDVVFCEARPQGGRWQSVEKVPIDPAWGAPTLVRIGKTSKTGGADDYGGDKGELVRLRVLNFAAYGELDKNKLVELKQKTQWKGLRVSVHYELYDGIPLMSKWLTVYNGTDRPITVDRFTAEELAVVEHDNPVEIREGVPIAHPDVIHVETDMAFGGGTHQNANRHVVHWRRDPDFKTQVNYTRNSPCLLVVEPTYGPAQDVAPGQTFESFRVFELVYDTSERERCGLALKRMYRTIAPWVTENPLMMHMRTAQPDAVRRAIDQCAEVGFEMLILSFGSGFNAENDDPKYLQRWKEIADYAHSKGIHIGCYSLLSSRRVRDEDMIVSPPGQHPTHGQCPALTSKWGQEYFRKLYNLFEKTGFDVFEHDGSYPGDVDVTPRPPLQKGIDDSRWVQWRIISDFYKWLRGRGVYLNVPDYYYLVGSNKCGMGYRETNWSLPRAQQVIHTRQNIYDGTWTKTPSMGWMFVPLTQYHGGGAAATVEPLDKHLDHYEAMMNSNLGLGVQACYRGPRLYDTERTKAMVKSRVSWYKKYRDILESDMIHGRRADGRDLDWMLHVNPKLKEKAMLVVYNPTDHAITKTIRLPLYYTGLTETAVIRKGEGPSRIYTLDRHYSVKLKVTVPAKGFSWYVITAE